MNNTNHILQMATEHAKKLKEEKMPKVQIKPLSVNNAWRGRRFKTPEYKAYEAQVLMLLPKELEVPEGKLGLSLTAGLSSKGGDIDNIAKPFIDILQKKYGFNDSRIYKLELIKDIVKKGDEYIRFMVYPL